MSICEFTELDKASCAHCRIPAQRAPRRSLFDEPLGLSAPISKPEPLRTSSFPARYDGWCSNCKEPIYQGDPLVGIDGYYVHEECA